MRFIKFIKENFIILTLWTIPIGLVTFIVSCIILYSSSDTLFYRIVNIIMYTAYAAFQLAICIIDFCIFYDTDDDSCKLHTIGLALIIFGFPTMFAFTIVIMMAGELPAPFTLELFDKNNRAVNIVFSLVGISLLGLFLMLLGNAVDNRITRKDLLRFQLEYDKYADKLCIDRHAPVATMIQKDESGYTYHPCCYFWTDGGLLCWYPCADSYFRWRDAHNWPDATEPEISALPIDSILFFAETGELRKYSVITGGGEISPGAWERFYSGYTGKPQPEPIRTKIVTEDDRIVELMHYDKDGCIGNMEFEHDAYKVLKNLIPTKEYLRIIRLEAACGIDESHDTPKMKKQRKRTN